MWTSLISPLTVASPRCTETFPNTQTVRETPVISYVPCILLVCPHSPRPHSGVFPGNPETPECSRRPPEHLTLHQAPLQGTPLYSPLPHYFLCMCRVILAGFPQSILFGSSLASLSDFHSTARLPLHKLDLPKLSRGRL